MKKQVIRLTSRPKSTQIQIRKGHRLLTRPRFASINKAIDFVRTRGSLDREFCLNGFSRVYHRSGQQKGCNSRKGNLKSSSNSERQGAMKKLIIYITSLAKLTRIEIRNGNRWLKPRYVGSIDEAIAFVLPLGNRHTELYLNGFPCVLHGWVQ